MAHDFNNRTLTVKGKVRWAKLFEDNMETTTWNEETKVYDIPCPKGGSFSVTVELDAGEFMELRMSGCMMTKYSKITDDGLEAVKFRRWNKPTDKNGKVKDWMAGPPKVTKPDGTVWNFEEDGPVWNESRAEFTISMVDYPGIKGVTTLESVHVLELAAAPVRDDEAEDEVAF